MQLCNGERFVITCIVCINKEARVLSPKKKLLPLNDQFIHITDHEDYEKGGAFTT